MSEDGEPSASKPQGTGQIDEQYIQSEIDKLNIDELVQPEQNNALKRVIKTDRKIVINLDSKISTLHKSCQYGKQVSKIINFKAEGLSSISLKEKLRLILETLSGEFSEEAPTEGEEGEEAEEARGAGNVGEDQPRQTSPYGGAKRLSFTKLSKYFSVGTLPFCPINYDTIPLNLFLDSENGFSLHRKEQKKTHSRTKQTLGNTTYRKLKEFTHENEPEIKLETDANKVLCIRTSDLFRHTEERLVGDGDGDGGDGGDSGRGDGHGGGNYSARHTGGTLPPRKNQALLTAWSYQKWEKLANRLAPHR
ncbi:hypothetical protein PCYB_103170 [Plasmodium cynomolgi strain B]|uniref:Uncharacterized protein n=1 Tax=Plasmodium cynomolgi (strain B) TaxID=1120755 RepID=K6VCL8_PLACD|nr:hypothetical protein PCYB_103170 [Plasmodium cynomolgi strain B]GAB66967.1 hypothetical protein PCYB_103170 [Plasmodium cynomolgi strain B]